LEQDFAYLKILSESLMRLSALLFAKSLLVGTRFGVTAQRLRWSLEAARRYRRPELWELYLEERRLPLVLQRLLTDSSRCVDVGCHIGSFLSLLKKYAPRGRHIAFEASVTKSSWLKRRFPDVEIFSCAVTNKSGRVFFEEDHTRPGYSHLHQAERKSPNSSTSYEVEACRLDDVLLDQGKIDFIKFDIEGGELAALEGARELLNKWRPPFIFECGSERTLKAQNIDRKTLFEFITADLNYQAFCFGDFLFGKGELTFDEFRKCGIYPFRAFNFVAIPRSNSN
jgi:FkbM family methyltransferase